MHILRLPLLARNAGARLVSQAPLVAYALSAVLATIGVAFIFWPAAFLVMSAFLLAVVAL